MKQPIILVNKHGRPSMRRIYKAIGGDLKLLVNSSRFNGYVERHKGVRRKLVGLDEPDCRSSVVIRWGAKCPIQTDEHSIVYNKIEATEKSNNKPLCRKILQDAGISVPKTFFPDSDFSTIQYPVLARFKNHGRGIGIEVANNYEDIKRLIRQGYAYFSEFYDKKREIRVHCFQNKVLSVMEKTAPANKQIAWNHYQNKIPFQVLDRKDWPMEACLLALEGVNHLGLDFGAGDLLLDGGPGKPSAVICEINTAPTLCHSDYNTDRYIEAFKWLFASDKRRPKWNYKLFKKVESLGLKRFQTAEDFDIPAEFQLK